MLSKRWNQNGNVIVMSETTDCPISFAGECAGICWNANVRDHEKNYKRGLECLKSGHGRVLEYPQIYLVLSGWSARVIREFYTHIGDNPTRLQESTRYVDCSNFNYVVPPSIERRIETKEIYDSMMDMTKQTIQTLEEMGIPREDSSMTLPLGMETKVVVRTNLRALISMAEQRKCLRAYWEFRQLFSEIEDALKIYSDEWWQLIEEEHIFAPKCEKLLYCPERNGCGRKDKMSKEEVVRIIEDFKKGDIGG